jgi:hypothetical protein
VPWDVEHTKLLDVLSSTGASLAVMRGNLASAVPARPPPPVEPAVLAAGRRFHHEVQAAYVVGMLGVNGAEVIERTILRHVEAPVSDRLGRRDPSDGLVTG